MLSQKEREDFGLVGVTAGRRVTRDTSTESI